MGDMLDFLKKGMYTGLGLVTMSKEAIEKAAKKIGEEMKLSQEEGKKVYDEMSEKAEEAKKDLQNAIDNSVEKTLKSLKLAKLSELEELKKRVADLEGKPKDEEG